jgi:hypothetical protein
MAPLEKPAGALRSTSDAQTSIEKYESNRYSLNVQLVEFLHGGKASCKDLLAA